MQYPRVLLVLVAVLCCSSSAWADSVGARGIYDVTGFATLTGSMANGCGSAPCVETWQFSFVFSVSLIPGFTQPLYDPTIIGGPGITSAVGSMSGPWSADRGDPFGAGSFLDIHSSGVELDLQGFYSPSTFVPQPGTRNDQAYVCLDAACLAFFDQEWGSGYQGTIGSYTEFVQQVPEPSCISLLAFGLVSALGIRRKLLRLV